MNNFSDSIAKVYARIISREKEKCDISGNEPAYTIDNVPQELRDTVVKILENQNNEV